MKRLAVLLLLAGCSQTPANDPLNKLVTDIQGVAVPDLANAEAMAVASGDTLMIPCYPALSKFVASIQGAGATPVNGAFSAFQAARNKRMAVQKGLPDYLKLACAAGLVDEAQFLTSLGALIGGAVVLAPIAPALAPKLVP